MQVTIELIEVVKSIHQTKTTPDAPLMDTPFWDVRLNITLAGLGAMGGLLRIRSDDPAQTLRGFAGWVTHDGSYPFSYAGFQQPGTYLLFAEVLEFPTFASSRSNDVTAVCA